MDKKRRVLLAVFMMIFMISLSRGIALEHNMYLHPDENVFVHGARSLKDKLMGLSEEYTEAKEYPEGAYVFQAPFHMLAELIKQATGYKISGFVCGRIASVTYFVLGAVIGSILVYQYMDQRQTALITYSLTAIFGLLHIEQSRYGTGDAITMFLVMAVVLFCALAGEKKRKMLYLFLASAFCGFLGAVKYPLLFFICLPITMLWRVFRKQNIWKRSLQTILLLPISAAGFLICSPRVIFDPYYILRVIHVESLAYIRGGNLFTLGGWHNHVASIVLYSLLYEGFPLAIGFAVFSIWSRWKNLKTNTDCEYLFQRILPLIIAVYFCYNVMAISLFMRSVYPFFFLCDLYTASAVSELYHREGKAWKIFLCVLTVIMVGRGSFFIYALSEKNSGERLNSLIRAGRDENWTETTLLAAWPLSGPYLEFDNSLLVNPSEVFIQNSRFQDRNTAELRPGEMAITGTEDFSRSNRYIFPFDNETVHDLIGNWETFKNMNSQYYVGQVYPRYYYVLFGFWIKGTTGTDYEFPSNYVYYRST